MIFKYWLIILLDVQYNKWWENSWVAYSDIIFSKILQQCWLYFTIGGYGLSLRQVLIRMITF